MTQVGEGKNAEELITSKFDYSKFNTYVLPESIQVIDDRNSAGDNPLSPEFEALILKTIGDRMKGLGYTEAPNVASSDVGLAVGVVIAESYVVSGGGYWGCGWYYYPCYGYYPPVTATSYETGTLIMDMLNFTTAATDTLPVVWQGAINGLASSKSSLNESRIIDGINQAYKQSSYLKSAGTGGP